MLSVSGVPGPQVGCAVRAPVLGRVVDGIAKCCLEHVNVNFLVVLAVRPGFSDHFDIVVFLLLSGCGRPCFGLWACQRQNHLG